MELTTTTTTTHTLTLDDGRTFDLAYLPATLYGHDPIVQDREDGSTVLGYLVNDTDPRNPREDADCYVGTMVTWHSRYLLGDEQPTESPQDYLIGLAQGVDYDVDEDTDPARVRDILAKHYIILPLFLMDHSGLSMSTGSFGDSWDSGQVGIVWCERGYEGQSDETLTTWLRDEVSEYDDYLRGSVYGVVTEVHAHGKAPIAEAFWGVCGDDHAWETLEGAIPA